MKALSLWQPWATLVAIGAKRVETRSWSTAHRGPLAIVSTAITKKSILSVYMMYPTIRRALRDAGYSPADSLPDGVVLATVDLVDCVEMTADNMPSPDSDEFTFGDYRIGRFMWKLDNFLLLAAPIPARGRQMLWEWTPPADWRRP